MTGVNKGNTEGRDADLSAVPATVEPGLEAATDSATGGSWIGYVAPMALFTGLSMLETGDKSRYIWIYILKIVIVSLSLILFRKTLRDYRPEWRAILPGLIVGLLVFVEWIWIDPHTPHMALGKRVAFDPLTLPEAQRALFLFFRLFGLAVMVPIMEELFWRSFLIRYITTEKFQSIPPYAFSWGAFAAVAAAFAVAHPEWLAALICAVAYGLLLRQTKSLFACLVAHATTNLTLGIYVLVTHHWQYW